MLILNNCPFVSAVAIVSLLCLQDDVHRVFAPGKIYFIKRLDKHKGRAKYGNTVHKCALCESDDAVPPPDHDHDECDADDVAAAADVAPSAASTCEKAAAAAAAGASSTKGVKDAEQEFYPGAKFELIEAEPHQRFQRIVLRETCLLDHLTSGYVQGLKYALQQAKQTA
jgi:hypothetical protein